MKHDLEKQIHDALRPVDPPNDIADRVLRQLGNDVAEKGGRRRTRRTTWIPASLAASAVLAVVGHHQWQVHRREEALRAKQELIEALRVTSAKLDLAYQVVREKDQESSS